MYRCINCERLFNDPERITVSTGVRSEHWQEEYEIDVCPNCGSDYIVAAHRCEICGEYEELIEGENYCVFCHKDMESVLVIAFENFKKQHDISRQKIIDLASDVLQDWEL